MKVALAADHAGLELKNAVVDYLQEKGIEYTDYGLKQPDKATDYPDYAFPAAKAVAGGECDFGVLICGTGIGMSICANKVKGIRCAVCGDCFSAEATRLHNNANMIALGARVTGSGLAIKILDVFLTTGYSEAERHTRRINKIENYCE